MEKYESRRGNLYGQVRFGAISANTFPDLLLSSLEIPYNKLKESANITYKVNPSPENAYSLIIMKGLLDVRYNMAGVIGYGIGINQDLVEERLRDFMAAAGCIETNSEVFRNNEVVQDSIRSLDSLLLHHLR